MAERLSISGLAVALQATARTPTGPYPSAYSSPLPLASSPLSPLLGAHAVFDVVVDDEVEFFVGEAVVLGEHAIYLIYDGLGEAGLECFG